MTIFSTLTQRYQAGNTTAPSITTVTPDNTTYKWQINAQIYSTSKINFLISPTHKDYALVTYSSGNTYAKIELNPAISYNPNKDFEILFSNENIFILKLLIENYSPGNKNLTTSGNDILGYINFLPKFNEISNEALYKNLENQRFLSDNYINSFNNLNTQAEFIFIADRSGSMSGNRNTQLINALKNFIGQLPQNSYFNVISFGSEYELMYPSSQLIKEKSSDAISKVNNFQADFGGTEIYEPLKKAFELSYINNIPRIIFILTDGDVSNSDQIISLAKSNKNKARVNSVGIGSGASTYLVKGVAKAGNGIYELVKDVEDLKDKTLYMIKNSISPYLTNFKLKFSSPDDVLDTYPKLEEVPFILKNEAFNLFFFLKPGYNKAITVEISYYDSYDQKNYNDLLKLESGSVYDGTVLHKLAAKRKIDDLMQIYTSNTVEAEYNNKKIVDLSVGYQVLSEKTAFILVVQVNENVGTNPAVKVDIPNVESTDYNNFYIQPTMSVNLPGYTSNTGDGISLKLSMMNILLFLFFMVFALCDLI